MQLRRRHFPNTVITENPAIQKFYVHFFIDNSNANISLYTLSCPDFNLGQLKVYKMKFTLELSIKNEYKNFGLLGFRRTRDNCFWL